MFLSLQKSQAAKSKVANFLHTVKAPSFLLANKSGCRVIWYTRVHLHSPERSLKCKSKGQFGKTDQYIQATSYKPLVVAVWLVMIWKSREIF